MTVNPELEALIAKVEAALAEEQQSRSVTTETLEEQNRSFAQAQTETERKLAEMQAALEESNKRREALEKQLELQVVSQTMDEIHSFSDALVADGKLPPALKAQVETLLSVQANLEGDVKSYALGDAGEHAEKSPFALLTELLGALPVHSQFKAISKDAGAAGRASGAGGAVDVRRYANDTEAATEMHQRIKALEKEKGLSYLQAFKQVNQEAIEAQG